MARRRVTQVICAAEPHGSTEAVEGLLQAARDRDVQAVILVGDLGGGDDRQGSYRSVFRMLGSSDLPAFWVPGPDDAPVGEYLREAHNIEVVFPFLHGVHGTAGFAPGHILVSGIGGEVSDDPDEERDEVQRLRYPRWEAEYRLKLLRELDEYQLVLVFSTPPAHKGLGTAGSEVLAELVNTHRARLVVCGGARGAEVLGRSMVVAPGSLREGQYAVADIHSHEVELQELAATG